MKRILYRILRNRVLWVIIVSLFVITNVLSITYCKEEMNDEYKWGHYITRYNNQYEIKEQIDELKKEIEYKDYDENLYDEEYRTELKTSVNILEYILSEGYSYDEINDGEVLASNKKERRSFSNFCFEFVYVFQIVSSILLICVLSNQGKNNGNYEMDLIIYGRKKMFKDELLTYLFLNAMLFFIHLGLVFSMRLMLPETNKYVLYYNAGNIKVISENLEYIEGAVSLFLILIWIQAIVFFISKLITNSLFVGIFSMAVIVLWMFIVNNTSLKSFKMMGMLCPSNYQENCSVIFYFVNALIRTIFAVLLYLASYIVCSKKTEQ